MSRITVSAVESGTGVTAEVHAQLKNAAGGSIPNWFATLGNDTDVDLPPVE
ncbi:hypothetical protein [Trinickia mobilis]|uniref:hypothetical protein n=1 Tax=Trinickia mobilis TaxID=2816356 RepID=UPI001A8EB7A8|nr:hypothetical protein [Trinickia mobilis]